MALFSRKQKTVEELEQEKIALEADVEEREARQEVRQDISELQERRQKTLGQTAGERFKQNLAMARQKFAEAQARQAERRAKQPQAQQQPTRNIFSDPLRQQQPQNGGGGFRNVLGQDKPMRFGNVLTDNGNGGRKKKSGLGGGMTIGDVFGNLNQSQSAIFGGAKPAKKAKRRKKRMKKTRRKR